MTDVYARRRDLVCSALAEIGVDITPPLATIYVWAPVPEGHTSASFCELVLEESGVVVSPGGAYGPNGEGFFRISLTIDDDRLDRGRRAAALEHGGLSACTTQGWSRSRATSSSRCWRRCAREEPPIRLSALFFEPGAAEQVAAEILALGDVVVALGAPLTVHGDGVPAGGRRPARRARGAPAGPEQRDLPRWPRC